MNDTVLKEFLNNNEVFDLRKVPVPHIAALYNTFKELDLRNFKNEKVKEDAVALLIAVFNYDLPFRLKSKEQLRKLLRVIDFMKSQDTVFDCKREIIKTAFKTYTEEHYYQDNIKPYLAAIVLCRQLDKDLYADVWDLDSLHLSETKRELFSSGRFIDYTEIFNKGNREAVKGYMRYLLSILRPYKRDVYPIKVMFDFASYCDTRHINELTESEVKAFLDGAVSPGTYNTYLSNLIDLYNYLLVNGKRTKPNPAKREWMKKNDNHKETPIPNEYVIYQIFNHLKEADEVSRLIFLISYSTGMRISDICRLRRDCLEYDDNGSYYINFYCKKMHEKPESCLISKALFNLIAARIDRMNKECIPTVYLFPSKRDLDKPYSSGVYLVDFKSYCNSWKIKNQDGSLYNYTTHEYRRYLATELYENNVNPVIIQKCVLWHQEISMTSVYIKRRKQHGKEKLGKYFNDSGIDVDWCKDKERAHVLPNGYCGLSDTSGVCNGVFACMDCEHFKTTKEFLPVHEKQLEELKKQLELYEANNWLNNILTAKRQIQLLENIISSLKEGDS